MTEIKWYSNKQNIKTLTEVMKSTLKLPTCRIPLGSILISSSECFPNLNDGLDINSNSIKFNLPKSDKKLPVTIPFASIRAVQYAESIKVLKVILSKGVVSQIFPDNNNNKLSNLEDVIYFFVKYADMEKYVASQLSHLSPLPSKCIDMLTHYISTLTKSGISTIKEPLKGTNGDAHLKQPRAFIDNKSPEINEKKRRIKKRINESTSIKEDEPSNRNTLNTLLHKLELNSFSKTSPMEENNNFLSSPKVDKLKQKRVLKLVKTKGKKRRCTLIRKLLYSPSPTNSIEITGLDLECLKPKEYLNDNIINFYLTYIYHEILSPDQREAAYFFNVFFNTKLIGTESQQKVDTPATRHARVAKWTKKVDIFSKDFIVIPVIEDEHWFLVIICYPWMAGTVNYSGVGTSKTIKEIPNNDTDFAKNVRFSKIRSIRENQNIEAKPCIIIFDSLEGKKRVDKLKIIREYLKSEWDSRRLAEDGPLIFDKTTCRGYSPNILKQNNGTDCGLYLLQYVESFFKNPLTAYSKKDMQTNWFFDSFDRRVVNKKREFIKSIIETRTKEIFPDDNDDDSMTSS